MPNVFLETPRFPDRIAYSSKGGPKFATGVVEVSSGHESRNRLWAYPRYQYDVSRALDSPAQMEELVQYFMAVAGRYASFRFKDPMDYKSCALSGTVSHTDQVIGTGDGVTTAFQLKKTYVVGVLSQVRLIKKPVSGSALIGLAGVLQGAGYTVDYTTGVVTFAVAPGAAVSVTAGFEFDVPVRFDADDLAYDWESYSALNTSVMLVEDRLA